MSSALNTPYSDEITDSNIQANLNNRVISLPKVSEPYTGSHMNLIFYSRSMLFIKNIIAYLPILLFYFLWIKLTET